MSLEFYFYLGYREQGFDLSNGCPKNEEKHLKVGTKVCLSSGNSIFLSFDINLHLLKVFVLISRFLYWYLQENLLNKYRKLPMSLVNPPELEMYVYMVELQKVHSLEIWIEVNN